MEFDKTEVGPEEYFAISRRVKHVMPKDRNFYAVQGNLWENLHQVPPERVHLVLPDGFMEGEFRFADQIRRCHEREDQLRSHVRDTVQRRTEHLIDRHRQLYRRRKSERTRKQLKEQLQATQPRQPSPALPPEVAEGLYPWNVDPDDPTTVPVPPLPTTSATASTDAREKEGEDKAPARPASPSTPGDGDVDLDVPPPVPNSYAESLYGTASSLALARASEQQTPGAGAAAPASALPDVKDARRVDRRRPASASAASRHRRSVSPATGTAADGAPASASARPSSAAPSRFTAVVALYPESSPPVKSTLEGYSATVKSAVATGESRSVRGARRAVSKSPSATAATADKAAAAPVAAAGLLAGKKSLLSAPRMSMLKRKLKAAVQVAAAVSSWQRLAEPKQAHKYSDGKTVHALDTADHKALLTRNPALARHLQLSLKLATPRSARSAQSARSSARGSTKGSTKGSARGSARGSAKGSARSDRSSSPHPAASGPGTPRMQGGHPAASPVKASRRRAQSKLR